MAADRLLLRLCESGDYDGATAYISGEVLNALDNGDEEGRTALHVAAARGHVDIVSLLITVGAAVNAQDKQLGTALHAVCASAAEVDAAGGDGPVTARRSVVEALLRGGASPHVRDAQGRTPADLLSCSTPHGKELLWVFQMSTICRDAGEAPDTPERLAGGAEPSDASPASVTSLRLQRSPGKPSPTHRRREAAPTEAGRRQPPSPSPSPQEVRYVTPPGEGAVSPRRPPASFPAAVLSTPPPQRSRDRSDRAGRETTFAYLNRTVMPVLQPALLQVARERPEDPVALLSSLLQLPRDGRASGVATPGTEAATTRDFDPVEKAEEGLAALRRYQEPPGP